MFTSGGMAGVISWIVLFPYDPVKTLIQTTFKPEDPNYKTMKQSEAFRTIYYREGFSGFFRGLGTILIRAFLVHGVVFYTNETIRKSLIRNLI